MLKILKTQLLQDSTRAFQFLYKRTGAEKEREKEKE